GPRARPRRGRAGGRRGAVPLHGPVGGPLGGRAPPHRSGRRPHRRAADRERRPGDLPGGRAVTAPTPQPAAGRPAALELDDVEVAVPDGDGTRTILAGVALEVRRGELVTIAGRSRSEERRVGHGAGALVRSVWAEQWH